MSDKMMMPIAIDSTQMMMSGINRRLSASGSNQIMRTTKNIDFEKTSTPQAFFYVRSGGDRPVLFFLISSWA